MSESEMLPRLAHLTGAHGEMILTAQEDSERAEFWLTDLDGWFGGVGVEAHDVQRKIGHGMMLNPAIRTGRTLTLKGYFYFDSDRTRAVADRFVSGLLYDGKPGTLTVTVGELELSCQVRLDGEIKHAYETTQDFTLEVPLVAPEPWLYGKPITTQIFPSGAGTGLKYPLFFPEPTGVLSYGAKPPQGAAITHQGNATAHPKYVVRGEWPSGFRLTSAGRIIEYPYAVTQSSPVTIDCARGQVLIAGMDFTHQLTWRDWHSVPPRAGFTVEVEAPAVSTGWVDIEFRDTYI